MQDSPSEQEAFPVSSTQRDHLRAVEVAPYLHWKTRGRVSIEGSLDVAALQRAFAQLIERHEILRTSFRQVPGSDQWTQVISTEHSFALEVRDLRDVSEGAQEESLDALAVKLEAGFDLLSPCSLRAALARMEERVYVLLLTQPAVANDHLGLRNLITELCATLRGAGDQEPMQFADIALFLTEAGEADDSQTLRALWAQLEGDRPFDQRLALQEVAHPIARRDDLRSCLRFIDTELQGELADWAKSGGVSPASVHLAAWQVLLARHADTDRVITGVASPGRAYEGLETALGTFARHLPIASRTEAGLGFYALCKDLELRVQASENAHETFGFEALGRAQPAAWPFAFVYHALPGEEPKALTAGELVFEIEEILHRGESAHLRLEIDAAQPGTLRLQFDPAHFAAATVLLVAEQYEALLHCIVSDASGKNSVEEASSMPSSQKERLLSEFARMHATADARSGFVHEWIVEAARENPEAIAVIAEERQIDYRELDSWSDHIAGLILANDPEPGSFVGLYFERSVEMIASILGTLKAGCAYLPLPPDYPHERLEHMADDAEVTCVLSRAADVEGVPAFHATLLHVDPEGLGETEVATSSCTPETNAYAIYTSGSTGKPKGVPISHANLAHSTRARFATYKEPVGAYLLLSSFAFDSSVAGIFWTLSQGGTLVLPAAGFERDIPSLAGEIQRRGITHLLGLPSLWNALLDTSTDAELQSLKTVIVAGESCPPACVQNHRERLPHTALYNEYGPTEATVWASVFECTEEGARQRASTLQVPIGRPIPGAEVFVVARNGELAPIGTSGELYVGGAGVAAGYRNRPELTEQKFVPHGFGGTGSLYRTGDRVRFLADGNLEFLGRIDQQVKIRGYRIELEEIEAALALHEHINEAVVVAAQQDGDAQLVAYVVAHDELEEHVLLAHLASRLPEYMLPSSFVRTDALPLLPNGKVDRRALESSDLLPRDKIADQPTFEAPVSPVEKVLAFLWQDLLKKPSISRGDDFFQLGGHSILATQLYARILETLGVKIGLRSLFEERTLDAIARALTDQADDESKLVRRAEIALKILKLSDDEAEGVGA